jgi:hypothetical protein
MADAHRAALELDRALQALHQTVAEARAAHARGHREGSRAQAERKGPRPRGRVEQPEEGLATPAPGQPG